MFEFFRAFGVFGVFRVFGTFGVFDAFGANTPCAASATVDPMRQDRCHGRTKSGSESRAPSSGLFGGARLLTSRAPKLRGYGSRGRSPHRSNPVASFGFRVVWWSEAARQSKPSQPGFTCAAKSRQVPPTPAMASKKNSPQSVVSESFALLRKIFVAIEHSAAKPQPMRSAAL